VNIYLNTGLHALGDPTRLGILKSLAERPLAVVDLARGFPISRPAISQHLRILKDAGLVTDRHAGTQRIYQIDPAGIAALRAHFEALWSSVLDSFKAAAEGGTGSVSRGVPAGSKLKEKKDVGHSRKRSVRRRR
jgi:DNA-binding transcriptional ArsR family regulator